MAILPRAGRAAIAAAIKAGALHLAWGSGNVSWGENPPAENPADTALLAEIGRRKVTAVEFVVPDSNGNIEISGAGKFSITSTPTNRLYVKTQFDWGDAPTSTIREIGLFLGTVTDPLLPAGQQYFTPSQIISPGSLLQLEHRAPIIRSTGTRQLFELLIVI